MTCFASLAFSTKICCPFPKWDIGIFILFLGAKSHCWHGNSSLPKGRSVHRRTDEALGPWSGPGEEAGQSCVDRWGTERNREGPASQKRPDEGRGWSNQVKTTEKGLSKGGVWIPEKNVVLKQVPTSLQPGQILHLGHAELLWM